MSNNYTPYNYLYFSNHVNIALIHLCQINYELRYYCIKNRGLCKRQDREVVIENIFFELNDHGIVI